jgi:hypothetical protein
MPRVEVYGRREMEGEDSLTVCSTTSGSAAVTM